MPVTYRQSVRKSKKNKVVLVLTALVVALAVALCAVTVVTVMKAGDVTELSQDVADQQASISALQSQLDAATDAHASHQEAQESQVSQLQSQLEAAQSTIASQNKEIKDQKDTIDGLKSQLATAVTKPTTTTTLNQNLPSRYYGDYKGKKLVALTFDDGPGPYTERLLNEMKKRDVKATFFVLGNRVDRYPELIKRMEAEGHTIGNHSYDHSNLTKLSYENVRKNMERTAEKVEKLVGHKPEVMRCPGGACNSNVKKYAKAAGIPIIYWGVDTRDWESRNVDAIMKKSFGKGGITDGSIVLMHDIHQPSVEAAIKMMDRLIDEGYTFVTVPELLMARHGEIETGIVHY